MNELSELLIVVVLVAAIAHAMRRHDSYFSLGGIDSYFVWLMVGYFGLALVRIPIYIITYGWKFPFNPSDKMQLFTGIFSIIFWWAMIYWQIPMRLLGRQPYKNDKTRLDNINSF